MQKIRITKYRDTHKIRLEDERINAFCTGFIE